VPTGVNIVRLPDKKRIPHYLTSLSSPTFELRDVVALFNNDSLSDSSTGVDIPLSTSTALLEAFWKDSDIVVG